MQMLDYLLFIVWVSMVYYMVKYGHKTWPARLVPNLSRSIFRIFGIIYFAAGSVAILSTLGLLNASEVQYDSTGRLTEVRTDDGNRVHFVYDSAGNITSMSVVAGASGPPVLTSDPAPAGKVGVPLSHTLTSSRVPATFAATTLPAGLTLSAVTGAITGSPTAAGVYPVSVTVTSGATSSTSQIVFQIVPASSAPFILREPESQAVPLGQSVTLYADVDGSAPFAFQWLKNGVIINGANSLRYHINAMSASDVGSYALQVSNDAGIVSTAAYLSIAGASTFTEWAQTWGLPPGSSGMSDDPNGDGIPNLMAYAFGLAPNQNAVPFMPASEISGNTLRCYYRRSKSAVGIAWSAEVSSDLTHWTASGVSHQLISSNSSVETWRASVPILNGQPNFIRVKIDQQ